MIADADPVLAALARLDVLHPADLDLLRRHGQPYQGAPLPPGIEAWPRGQCLDASDALEVAGHGRFVIGFALRPGDDLPLNHAWITRDGRHALDAVWSEPTCCSYYGVPGRRHEQRLTCMWRTLRTAYGWEAELEAAWANVEIMA